MPADHTPRPPSQRSGGPVSAQGSCWEKIHRHPPSCPHDTVKGGAQAWPASRCVPLPPLRPSCSSVTGSSERSEAGPEPPRWLGDPRTHPGQVPLTRCRWGLRGQRLRGLFSPPAGGLPQWLCSRALRKHHSQSSRLPGVCPPRRAGRTSCRRDPRPQGPAARRLSPVFPQDPVFGLFDGTAGRPCSRRWPTGMSEARGGPWPRNAGF